MRLPTLASIALVAACSATPRTPQTRATAPVSPPAAPAPSPPATPPALPPAPPPPPAPERARAAASSRAELPPEAIAWLRPRVLRAIMHATGTLPAPTAPEDRDGVTVWSLVADVAVAPERVQTACAALSREEPAVACETDTTTWSGAERGRVSVAWRGTSSRSPVTLAQPLRALTRVGDGVCLVHAERTARTLDLTVQARDIESVGRTLAFVTSSPGLSDVILVREELRGAGFEALLSWPLDRVQGDADLGDDAWPTRCDGRSTVGADAPPRTAPVARERIRGRNARGAVVRVGRREWLVTEGDVVGAWPVTGLREEAVLLRVAGQRAPVMFRFPAGRLPQRPAR